MERCVLVDASGGKRRFVWGSKNCSPAAEVGTMPNHWKCEGIDLNLARLLLLGYADRITKCQKEMRNADSTKFRRKRGIPLMFGVEIRRAKNLRCGSWKRSKP